MSFELTVPGLEDARLRAGLTLDQLWIRYFGNGGTASATEFESFMASSRWPERLQYDIAVSALNDRFTEIELDHPVPYAD